MPIGDNEVVVVQVADLADLVDLVAVVGTQILEEVIAHWMLWSTTTLSEAIGSLLKKVQGNN